MTLGVISIEQVGRWIDSDARRIIEEIGPRLSLMEMEHYRAAFQTVDLRLAGLLLKLAGPESTVEGFTQEDLADRLGSYRETVTTALQAMKSDKLIAIDRKAIAILNRKALKEMSEL